MANMIPHEIEAAERIRSLPHYAARIIVFRQVGDNTDRLTTIRFDLRDDLLNRRFVDINDANRSAFLGKSHGTGASHAGTRRRHQPVFSF